MLGVRDFHLLNCSFAHLGGAGVSFAGGTQHSSVSGCEFYDISASGVTVGTAMSSYLALDPAAQDGGITIADNHIHSVAVEYSGAVGILSTFTAGLRIVHNTVHTLAYSCMSLGWSVAMDPQ